MAPALKPERGSHSSGTALARSLAQPTRMTGPETGRNACAIHVIPIRFCSRWGLPCRPCCHARGGLLPHPFTLTRHEAQAVFFLWHFPWGRPRRTLSGTVFPWSPDFPHPAAFRPLRSAAARPTGKRCINEGCRNCQRQSASKRAGTHFNDGRSRNRSRIPPHRPRRREAATHRGGRFRRSFWRQRHCRRSEPQSGLRRHSRYRDIRAA